MWYRERKGRLSWFYDLSARQNGGGKVIVKRSARGSASRALSTSGYCALVK